MELKNALTICLISFFSATLVLLIARALDLQAASKIEPQLEEIAKELRAIREGGGVSLGGSQAAAAPTDGVVVYYAHGNTRCPTCRKIETQSHEAVTAGFSEELEVGKLAWEIVNYEKPAGEHFIADYEVQMPVVVLVEMKNGQPGKWKRLDEVWGLVDEKDQFIDYVQKEIRAMLAGETEKTEKPQDKDGDEDTVKIVPPIDAEDAPPSPALPVPPLPDN